MGWTHLLDPLPPLVSALTWGLSPLVYKSYLARRSATRVNLLRTASAAAALSIPFLVYGFSFAIVYGALSGILTLALGDTLFFVSIRLVGASIATPLLYVQSIFIQLFAVFLGEPLTFVHLFSAIFIIAGVYLLSRGENSRVRAKGIAVGLLGAVLEGLGQTSIKLATSAEVNPLSIAFARTSVAALVLCAMVLFEKKGPKDSMGLRKYLLLTAVSIGDLALGSSLFIYSVGISGIIFPTIIVGLAPLVTQIGSRLLKRESPSATDYAAGVLIVIAITITVLRGILAS